MLAITALATLLATALAAPTPQSSRSTDATSPNAPVGKGKFALLTESEFGTGALGYAGQWVTSFHTGAGTADAITTFNQTDAALFNYHAATQDIYFESNKVPYSIGFSNDTAYMSNAPAGYYLVTINAGFANAGFEFSQYDNVGSASFPHEYLEVCAVNGTAPYFSLGPQYQMFWREAGTQANTEQCVGVQLKAVFKNGFA